MQGVDGSTHLVKEIDERSGIISPEAPRDAHVGSTAQECPNSRETFVRTNLSRVEVGPEPRV